MKRLLAYFLLTLSFGFIFNAKADDISDFQLEGMSIGDSVLDYLSKKEIIKNKKNYTKDKTFSTIEMFAPESKTYDAIQLNYKTN